jgi:peptide/nickel transport system permease protein
MASETVLPVSDVHVAGRVRPVFRAGRAVTWIRRNPLGGVGAALLLVAVVTSAGADLIIPYDPNTSLAGYRLAPPSAAHWFGTDNIARDLLSRVVYGARTTLFVALMATVVGVGAGWLFGLVSGYAGGWVDMVMQRALDIMMALPSLVLALMLVAMLGASVTNVILAIAVSAVPQAARVARSAVLSTKEEDYVLATRSVGARAVRLMLVHVLPGTVAPMIVVASVRFGYGIVTEASLSFLGVGVQPPTLGGLLSGQSRRFMLQAWWLALFPGLVISLLIFAVNVLGDALRDTLDPRLRRSG